MNMKEINKMIRGAKEMGMTQLILFNPEEVVIPPYIKDRAFIINLE